MIYTIGVTVESLIRELFTKVCVGIKENKDIFQKAGSQYHSQVERQSGVRRWRAGRHYQDKKSSSWGCCCRRKLSKSCGHQRNPDTAELQPIRNGDSFSDALPLLLISLLLAKHKSQRRPSICVVKGSSRSAEKGKEWAEPDVEGRLVSRKYPACTSD